MMSGREWQAVATGVGGTLVLGITLLFVQHVRHGWPFSLHHNLGQAAAPPNAEGVDTEHTAHARAPVEFEPSKLDAIGVRMDRVRKQTLAKPLRAVATIVPDESRISHVHTHAAGWIEQLYVNTTGQTVRAGQPLAGIFSQELLSTQNEYLSLRRATGAAASGVVLQSARSRLRVLGMTDREIDALAKTGAPSRLVTVAAPRTGVVIHRGISVGTAVDPSTELLTIADLSHVWLIAEVPENAIAGIQVGAPAVIEVPGSGRAAFTTKVEFLYPTLSDRTRTLRVRFLLDNRDGTLRPGLYATVDLQVSPHETLTVPRDAVVDTGQTQHVFVVERDGRFVPRTVTLGTQLDDTVEVTQGLREGEPIVSSGVFLIDSESRLRASGGGTGHAHGTQQTQSAPAAAPSGAAVHAEHGASQVPATSTQDHEGHTAP